MRSAGYAIGGTLGPFIGGVLAQPAQQFPAFFSQVKINKQTKKII